MGYIAIFMFLFLKYPSVKFYLYDCPCLVRLHTLNHDGKDGVLFNEDTPPNYTYFPNLPLFL